MLYDRTCHVRLPGRIHTRDYVRRDWGVAFVWPLYGKPTPRHVEHLSHQFALRVPATRRGERRQRKQCHASRLVACSTPAAPRAFSCRARRPSIAAQAVVAAVCEAASGATFRGDGRRSPGATARAHQHMLVCAARAVSAAERNDCRRLLDHSRRLLDHDRPFIHDELCERPDGNLPLVDEDGGRQPAACAAQRTDGIAAPPGRTHACAHAKSAAAGGATRATGAKSPFHRQDTLADAGAMRRLGVEIRDETVRCVGIRDCVAISVF